MANYAETVEVLSYLSEKTDIDSGSDVGFSLEKYRDTDQQLTTKLSKQITLSPFLSKNSAR